MHATGQFAHFDTRIERAPHEWVFGANSNLADDISVQWVRSVPGDFHARFSALSRSYRYTILNRQTRSSLARQRAWWIRQPLDVDAMRAALSSLRGEHDFTSFRASSCQAHSPVRTVLDLDISRHGEWIIVCCRANAFLHHMVRNIVGSVVQVGRHEREVHWLGELLTARDRRLAGMTAPAQGLCLTAVEYPDAFGLDTAELPFW